MSNDNNDDRKTGVIVRLLEGYGFLAPDGENSEEFVRGKGSVFMHRTALVSGTFESLQEGDRVTFRQISTPKGARAEEIEIINA